jgi:Putative MetA-pathway of phenol degradation
MAATATAQFDPCSDPRWSVRARKHSLPSVAPSRHRRPPGGIHAGLKYARCAALCGAFALNGGAAFAQATPQTQPPGQPVLPEPQNLEPDRPDVTNGTHIVDVGLVQIEVGGLYSRAGPAQHNLGTPITIRVGLADWVEVRIGGDGFLSSVDAEQRETGIGNVQLGAKVRLWADPGGMPVLSILPAINLSTASARKGLGSGQSDFTIALLTGTDFLTRGHVDVNYGFGLIGAGPGLRRFPQHLVSLSASAEVPGPVTPYAEVFWYSRLDPAGGHVLALDTGAIYVINPRFALDGGFQIGLNPAAPAFSVFGGLSVIVGNILGDHGVHQRQRQAARRGAARAAKGKG